MKIPSDKFFVLSTYDLLLANLAMVAKHRLNCSIYLSADKVIDNHKEAETLKIRDFFDENGLLRTTHGPFVDLSPGSFDSKIREATFKRFCEALEISNLLGSRHITFHSGYKPQYHKKYHRIWIENSINTWQKLIPLAEKNGITITIENAFEKTPEALVEIVKTVNSANFKICFDGGHFNAFSDTDPIDAFDMIPPELIGEIHLSDNDGSDDQHLPLGKGNIDVEALFKRVEGLKINPIFTLEPKDVTGAEADIIYLRTKGLI